MAIKNCLGKEHCSIQLVRLQRQTNIRSGAVGFRFGRSRKENKTPKGKLREEGKVEKPREILSS